MSLNYTYTTVWFNSNPVEPNEVSRGVNNTIKLFQKDL